MAVGSDAVTFDAAQAVAAPLEYESIVIDTLAPPGNPPPPCRCAIRWPYRSCRRRARPAPRRARRCGASDGRGSAPPGPPRCSSPSRAGRSCRSTRLRPRPSLPAVRTWSDHLAALARPQPRRRPLPARPRAATPLTPKSPRPSPSFRPPARQGGAAAVNRLSASARAAASVGNSVASGSGFRYRCSVITSKLLLLLCGWVAERFKALVLKTSDGQPSVGSNPTPIRHFASCIKLLDDRCYFHPSPVATSQPSTYQQRR